jgi:hypothetical protein
MKGTRLSEGLVEPSRLPLQDAPRGGSYEAPTTRAQYGQGKLQENFTHRESTRGVGAVFAVKVEITQNNSFRTRSGTVHANVETKFAPAGKLAAQHDSYATAVTTRV